MSPGADLIRSVRQGAEKEFYLRGFETCSCPLGGQSAEALRALDAEALAVRATEVSAEREREAGRRRDGLYLSVADSLWAGRQSD